MLLMLNLLSCKSTSAITKPQEISWGKAGTQPTKVWTDYNWIIVSTDKYNGD